MPLPLIRYPLDETGINTDNFVNGEIHTLSTKLVRAVAPTYGAFFTESLKVYDNRTQTLLVRGTQYICTELLQTPTELYGKEICYLILIIDPTVNSEIIIQYQVLGGLYTRSGDAIINIYETILQENRPVNWVDLLNKPLQFTPTQHLHDGRDIYGLEYVVTSLERIRNAIITSDVPAYESIMDWLKSEISNVNALINSKGSLISNETIRATAAEAALQSLIDAGSDDLLQISNDYKAADVLILSAAADDSTNKVNSALTQIASSGIASSATKLATARTINGVAFDGTTSITINAVDPTARIASTEKGASNGVAALDIMGKIWTSQLPSYVDDVIEFTNLATFPAVGEQGKIYVNLTNNKTYRWSGSSYIYITSGAVDTVAGKTGVVTLDKNDVGLGNVDNTTDAAKPVSTAQATAIALKADKTGIGASGTWPISITNTATLGNKVALVNGIMGSNDSFTISVGDISGIDTGYVEIATGDNGTEPIYVRQYVTGTLLRSASLLDGAGNTYFPGTITAAVDVVSNSDERIKENWRDLDTDFVTKWADVKCGTYDRTDIIATQTGLSAQSVEKILPHCVTSNEEGLLSLNYGSAAAVATVKIAQKTIENSNIISDLLNIISDLKEKIALLENKIL